MFTKVHLAPLNIAWFLDLLQVNFLFFPSLKFTKVHLGLRRLCPAQVMFTYFIKEYLRLRSFASTTGILLRREILLYDTIMSAGTGRRSRTRCPVWT